LALGQFEQNLSRESLSPVNKSQSSHTLKNDLFDLKFGHKTKNLRISVETFQAIAL
jgi:hypothetical protein